MQLIRWSYSRRGQVRAYFDRFPQSTLYFRRIRRYYFLFTIDWHEEDPIVTDEDKEQMHRLLNRELGREKEYLKRRTRSS
ncbi:hypothetical protein [Thalassobacillus hwangdonensis]